MSKPYISTATVGNAHKSDILDVEITSRFTVTASSDGFLKLWNNNNSERSLHKEVLVDKVGLHHVSVLEDMIDMKREMIFAVVSFSGTLYLWKYDTETEELINLNFDYKNTGLTSKTLFWFPKFVLGTGEIKFACTTVTGRTMVFDVIFDNGFPSLKFMGELFSNDTSFATCLSIDIDNNRIVIGHQNGNVYLYDIKQLLLSYNFESFGIKSSKSLNIVRSVAFSPNGELLAVANDSGSYGTISLYDVKYGEYLGAFVISTHSSNVGVGNYAHSKWCMSINFNKDGKKLVSCGLDNLIRVWDVESRSCLNTIKLNKTDLEDEDVSKLNDMDVASCTSIKFVEQGIFKEDGQNDGLVVVGFDRSIRWFREAGGL